MSKTESPLVTLAAHFSERRDVVTSHMFGMKCLKVNGKAFLGEFEGDVVFKLTGTAHADALKVRGAVLFDPGMGRPMKEWVRVPKEEAKTWTKHADASYEYVKSLVKKA